MDVHNDLVACSDAAFDYMERLRWGPVSEGPVNGLPAMMVAGWLRSSGTLSTSWRVRARDGEWVLIRAGLVPDAGTGNVVLTFEPAPVAVIAPLAATAYGLTAREREVMGHLLADRTREQIARALFVSPYTVQDHLKSIYAKTGTSGRRGLMALLTGSECLPRMGAPIGPDGWFTAR